MTGRRGRTEAEEPSSYYPRVVTLVDREAKRLRYIIEWDRTNYSEVSYRRVETRWSSGEMVRVKPGSVHARICRQVLKDLGYRN